MKFRYKNSDCEFDSEQLDEIRERTKKESKQRIKNKNKYSEDDFFRQQKNKRK